MRAAIVVGVLALVVVGAGCQLVPASAASGDARAVAAGNRAGWKPAVRVARAYARARAGVVSFAIHARGRTWGYRRAYHVPSASTVKTLLALAYLRQPGVRRRGLARSERRLLARMIRRSGNRAASRVRNVVGNPALARVAAAARLRDFAVHPDWGACTISARDLMRLFHRVRELAPRRHRRFLLRLHRTIVPPQRWGVARARPDGWRLYFKGGWGDGDGDVDHQGALLVRGRRRIALGITTLGNPSHAYGMRTLEGVARRLLRGL